jgi:hypothetical protein
MLSEELDIKTYSYVNHCINDLVWSRLIVHYKFQVHKYQQDSNTYNHFLKSVLLELH